MLQEVCRKAVDSVHNPTLFIANRQRSDLGDYPFTLLPAVYAFTQP